MPHTDSPVSARAILEAQLELQRHGSTAVLAQLEELEPELANYVMETQSLLYQQLLALGGKPKATQRVFRQMEALVLVTILAQRNSHLELWRQGAAGTPLAALQQALEAPAPDAPPPPTPGE